MKLKTVFILFNAIVISTFLLVFLMPIFFLGLQFTTIFWRSNWYLIVLFLVVLAALNTYFALNWRLFSALEREDWREIADVLEDRVLRRGRYSDSNIRLLVNAYVVSSRSDAISKLEHALREKKPDVLRRHVLRLGIPHLLSNDGERIEKYFGEFRNDLAVGTGSGEEIYWVEWCYAFGLLLQGRMDEGRQVLEKLVEHAPAGIVRGTALYLVGPHAEAVPGGSETIEEKRREFVQRMSREEWKKVTERERTELHVLVLSKLLRDVEQWLYEPDKQSGTTRTSITGTTTTQVDSDDT